MTLTNSLYSNPLRVGLITSAGLCLALGLPAHADQALTMTLHAYKVEVSANGKIVYTPVSTAPVGSVIQYKATYKNNIDKPINDVMVVLPIPADMTFTGEAYPPSAQASSDGQYYADIPLMRRVSGKLVKVPYAEYKSLRWDIKFLPAKKTADVALNTIVK